MLFNLWANITTFPKCLAMRLLFLLFHAYCCLIFKNICIKNLFSITYYVNCLRRFWLILMQTYKINLNFFSNSCVENYFPINKLAILIDDSIWKDYLLQIRYPCHDILPYIQILTSCCIGSTSTPFCIPFWISRSTTSSPLATWPFTSS